jgi:hypothetical protein
MQGREDEAAAAGEGGGGNTFNDAELDEKIHGDFLISKKKNLFEQWICRSGSNFNC